MGCAIPNPTHKTLHTSIFGWKLHYDSHCMVMRHAFNQINGQLKHHVIVPMTWDHNKGKKISVVCDDKISHTHMILRLATWVSTPVVDNISRDLVFSEVVFSHWETDDQEGKFHHLKLSSTIKMVACINHNFLRKLRRALKLNLRPRISRARVSTCLSLGIERG